MESQEIMAHMREARDALYRRPCVRVRNSKSEEPCLHKYNKQGYRDRFTEFACRECSAYWSILQAIESFSLVIVAESDAKGSDHGQ